MEKLNSFAKVKVIHTGISQVIISICSLWEIRNLFFNFCIKNILGYLPRIYDSFDH